MIHKKDRWHGRDYNIRKEVDMTCENTFKVLLEKITDILEKQQKQINEIIERFNKMKSPYDKEISISKLVDIDSLARGSFFHNSDEFCLDGWFTVDELKYLIEQANNYKLNLLSEEENDNKII